MVTIYTSKRDIPKRNIALQLITATPVQDCFIPKLVSSTPERMMIDCAINKEFRPTHCVIPISKVNLYCRFS